jgi:hypothetical protein
VNGCQIAHFNIFVLAHKNANEPAGVLPEVVLSVMADVIGFCGKLLELSVKCLVLWQM